MPSSTNKFTPIKAIKKAKKVKVDPLLVALSPLSEENRKILIEAKYVLESPKSSKEDRDLIILYLHEIYTADEDHRTLYHFLCACNFLSIHSTENLATRKMYATKVENESKKKLRKIALHMDTADNEFYFSEQIYEGLKKMAKKSLDEIGEEIRKAVAEGKSIGEVAVQENLGREDEDDEEARHVKKKKRVSWGKVEAYSDDDNDEGDGDWKEGTEGNEEDDDFEDEDEYEVVEFEDEEENDGEDDSDGEEEEVDEED